MLGGQRMKEQMKKGKKEKAPSGMCISAVKIYVKPGEAKRALRLIPSQKYGN